VPHPLVTNAYSKHHAARGSHPQTPEGASRFLFADVIAHSFFHGELARSFKQGFDVARSRDPDAKDMHRPRGTFIVAMSDGLPIGCVGLKGSGGGVAEIKRLWVAPSARGLGLGRRLMDAAESAARELSIKVLRLDTNSALPEARQLYRSSGWTEIERFNDDPYPDLFFEKRL
jgi:GNAT superfamily N-acetyltransferase